MCKIVNAVCYFDGNHELMPEDRQKLGRVSLTQKKKKKRGVVLDFLHAFISPFNKAQKNCSLKTHTLVANKVKYSRSLSLSLRHSLDFRASGFLLFFFFFFWV